MGLILILLYCVEFQLDTSTPFFILWWTNCFFDNCLRKIDGVSYHMDDNKMEKVVRGFCKGINGVFAGCIGALDGWLVKIEKPSLIRDGVQNPSLYFSRKGFYGVNVQIIVSHNKTFCIVEQNMIQLHLKMGLLENG